MEDKLLYRDEVYAIQGALFDVYKTMGNMWGEEVYQQCLEKELALRNIPFEAKKELPIFYKGEKIEKKYIPDVFCFGKIILELLCCAQHNASYVGLKNMLGSRFVSAKAA